MSPVPQNPAARTGAPIPLPAALARVEALELLGDVVGLADDAAQGVELLLVVAPPVPALSPVLASI